MKRTLVVVKNEKVSSLILAIFCRAIEPISFDNIDIGRVIGGGCRGSASPS